MQDDQDIPPPLPPPLPPLGMAPPPLPPSRPAPALVAPLEYSRPIPGYGATNTIFHQAAKAAWVAPLIAMLLGCLTSQVHQSAPPMRMILGVVYLLLILGGFALAIVAFCGIKRYGPVGILAPAIAGLIINLLFIGFIGYFVYFAQTKAVAKVAAARALAARPVTPFSSPQSSLRQNGWMGAVVDNGTLVITVVAMDNSHGDTKALRSSFKSDASVIILSIDNRKSQSPATLDTRNAQLVFSDGRKLSALDPSVILQPADLMSMSPPFQVPAGALLEGKMLFIPADLDLSKLQLIRMTLSGSQVEIPGRIFTAAEKNRLIAASQQQP
jgi:hypothetical protein